MPLTIFDLLFYNEEIRSFLKQTRGSTQWPQNMWQNPVKDRDKDRDEENKNGVRHKTIFFEVLDGLMKEHIMVYCTILSF